MSRIIANQIGTTDGSKTVDVSVLAELDSRTNDLEVNAVRQVDVGSMASQDAEAVNISGGTIGNNDVSQLLAVDSILGTVSQAGGVPTGAIIERGSNANGEYVRYADGTQICWCQGLDAYFATTADGPIYKSNGVNIWTFPAAFIDGVGVSAVASSQATSGRWFNARVSSNLDAEITRQSTFSDSSTRAYRAIAIGRWY